jgi:hypothetical protein
MYPTTNGRPTVYKPDAQIEILRIFEGLDRRHKRAAQHRMESSRRTRKWTHDPALTLQEIRMALLV